LHSHAYTYQLFVGEVFKRLTKVIVKLLFYSKVHNMTLNGKLDVVRISFRVGWISIKVEPEQ
jgi:hypothetical protein